MTNLTLNKVPSQCNKLPASKLYCALMHIKLAQESNAAGSSDNDVHLDAARQNLVNLSQWVRSAPDNVKHMVLLVEAEIAAYEGNRSEALNGYDQAIAEARRSRYWNDAAIACECAALFFERWNKPDLARYYWRAAYEGYLRWGATANAKMLADLASESENRATTPSSLYHAESSQSVLFGNLTDTFDIRSALQATQLLSSATDLGELLEQVVHTIKDNAGAQTCRIYVPEGDDWLLLADDAEERCRLIVEDKQGANTDEHRDQLAAPRYWCL